MFSNLRSQTSTNRFRPQLEALEDRYMPSFSPMQPSLIPTGPPPKIQAPIVEFDSGTLRLIGTTGNDSFRINDNQEGQILEVINGRNTYTFNSEQVQRIEVDLYHGHDSFVYYLGSDMIHDREIDVDFGTGGPVHPCASPYHQRDIVTLDFNHAYPREIDAELDINVRGYPHSGNGESLINLTLGEIRDDVNIDLAAGRGKSDMLVRFWGDVDSDVVLNMLGSPQDDMLRVEQFTDITSNANVEIYMDGGGRDDTLVYQFGGVLHGGLQVEMFGGAGHDVINFTYQGHGLHGQLDVNQNGGSGDDEFDTFIVLASDSDGDLEVNVNGDGGDDVFDFDLYDYSDENVDIETEIDGGANYDRARTSGNIQYTNVEYHYVWD